MEPWDVCFQKHHFHTSGRKKEKGEDDEGGERGMVGKDMDLKR